METTKTVAERLKDWIDGDICNATMYEGGYVKFESFENKVLTIGAYQEYSTMKALQGRLKEWLILKAQQRLNIEIEAVTINSYVPYFK